jgi:hypothetical protein
VTHVSTTPLDGNRVVQAHGLAPGELEQRKPHLVDLLRTTFTVRLVGYGQASLRVAGTPPTPPRLHCFLYAANEDEIRGITASETFLRPLTQVTDTSLQDLLVCALQSARDAWPVTEQHTRLVRWGKFLARLLRDDYLTLEGVFERLSPESVPPSPATAERTAPERRAPLYEEPIKITGPGKDPFDF